MSDNVNISLHSDIKWVLDRLEAAGFEAYTVGGFVRDAILGKTAGDCDITTSAMPEEIKYVFRDERTIDTGIKHGTVTLVYNDVPYEITTYRVDGEYADNRHPDKVEFTASLEEDLARRDFTVNAMAYSERRGLVDVFGGRADISAGIIRAVGDPTRRFTEDALRILRALRFASVLNFRIEEATRAAIFAESYRLASVSVERILVELRKLMSGVGAYRILSEYGELVAEMLKLPTVKLPAEEIFTEMTGEERLISLFYLSSEYPADAFERSMRNLKSDRQTERRGTAILRIISDKLEEDRLLSHIIDEGVESVLAAVSLKSRLDGDASALRRVEKLLASGAPTALSSLAVDGSMLVALGYKGERIGTLLRAALLAAMRGEIENDRREMLNFIKYFE